MKKITMRFCERNLCDEGSQVVADYHAQHNMDLITVEKLSCLSHCSLCNQGSFCALNDILFQEKDPHQLNQRLDNIFFKLRQALIERQE